MGICIYLSPLSCNILDNRNNIIYHEQYFFYNSSYNKWNKIVIHLLYALINYIKCCNIDLEYNNNEYLDFLHNFEEIQHSGSEEIDEMYFLVNLLEKNDFLLEKNELQGIYFFINILKFNTLILYKKSFYILDSINKIYDFILNDSIKKEILKIKELLLISVIHDKNICIE